MEAGIFTKAKWWLQDNFGNMKNMSGNLLPRKDEPKAIGSGEGEQQEETPQVEPQKAEPGKDKFGNNITKSQEEIDRDNQVANNEETVVENDNSERE